MNIYSTMWYRYATFEVNRLKRLNEFSQRGKRPDFSMLASSENFDLFDSRHTHTLSHSDIAVGIDGSGWLYSNFVVAFLPLTSSSLSPLKTGTYSHKKFVFFSLLLLSCQSVVVVDGIGCARARIRSAHVYVECVRICVSKEMNEMNEWDTRFALISNTNSNNTTKYKIQY